MTSNIVAENAFKLFNKENNVANSNEANSDTSKWVAIFLLVIGILGMFAAIIKDMSIAYRPFLDKKKREEDRKAKEDLARSKHEYKMEEERFKAEARFQTEMLKNERFHAQRTNDKSAATVWHSSHYKKGMDEGTPKNPFVSMDNVIAMGSKMTHKYIPDTPFLYGDFVVISSSTGKGKSILGTQTAVNAAYGFGSKLLGPDITRADYSETPDVYLIDTEMGESDYATRYKNLLNNGAPFIKALLHPDLNDYTDLLSLIDEQVFANKKDCVFIIDNVTTLPSHIRHHAEKIATGLREIQSCVVEMGFTVTFIIVAHITKNGKENSSNGIGGSVEWSRLATQIVQIVTDEKDNSPKLRISKMRNGISNQEMYVKIEKLPYLHFECDVARNMKEFGTPCPFKPDTKAEKMDNDEIGSYVRGAKHLKDCGMSTREIGNLYGVSHSTIHRTITKYSWSHDAESTYTYAKAI